MYRYVFILLDVCIITTICNSSKISDLRLCADENCETTISHAKSLARVSNPDTTFLSFERGSVVNVLSKSAGNRPDLWGGEVNGRKGYFPRSFVREFHVLIPNPEKIVPTEPHLSIEEKILGHQPKTGQGTNKEETTPDKTEKSEKSEKDDTEVADETEISDDDDDSDSEVKDQKTESGSKDEVKAEKETEKQDKLKAEKEAEKQDDLLKQSEQEKEKELPKQAEPEKQDEIPKQHEQDKQSQIEVKSSSELDKESKEDKDSQPETKSEDEVDETEIDKEFEDDWDDETEMPDDEDGEESTTESKPKVATKLNSILHQAGEHKAEADKSTKPDTRSDDIPTPDEKKEQDITEPEEKTDDVSHQVKKDELTKPVVSSDDKIMSDEKTQDLKMDGKETEAEEEKTEEGKFSEQGQIPEGENLQAEKKVDEPSIKQEKENEQPHKQVKVDKQPKEEVKSGDEDSVESRTIKQEGTTGAKVNEQVLQSSDNKEGHSVEQHVPVSDEKLRIKAAEDESIPQVLDDKQPKETNTDEQSSRDPDVKQTETPEKSRSTAKEAGDHVKTPEDETEVKAEESQVKSKEQKSETEKQMLQDKIKEAQADLKSREQLKVERTPQKDIKQEDKLSQDSYTGQQETQLETEMNQAAANEMQQKQPASQSTKEAVVDTKQQPIKQPVTDTTLEDVQESSSPVKPEETQDTDQLLNREQQQATDQSSSQETTPEKTPLQETKVEEKIAQETKVKDIKPDIATETKSEEQTKYVENIRSSQTATFKQDMPSQDSTPALEPTMTKSVTTETSMEGFTVIDGTPFPLDYFDEPTEVDKSAVFETSQSEIVPTPVIMNTQTGIRRDTEMLNTDTQPSYREEQKPYTSQNQYVQHSSEQLLSSMEVEQVTADQKSRTEIPESMQSNQTNMERDTSENQLPHQVVPDSKENMYATMDFLSRKPLSHDVNVQKTDNAETNQQHQQQGKEEQHRQQQAEHRQQQQQEQQQRKEEQQQQQQEVHQQQHQQQQEQEFPDDAGTKSESPEITSNQQQQQVPNEADSSPTSETVTDPTMQQEQEVPIPPTQESEVQQNVEQKDESVDVREKETTTLPFSDFDIPNDYNTEHVQSRKIDDETLEEQEDKEFKSQQMGTRAIKNLENRLKFVVEKLPPSVQSLLEQEPLGMSPWMTVLVSLSAILTLMTLTCVGLLCGGSKKQKKKDPVVVVKGLEEQLFIMTKEKENLEDELQSVRASIQDKEKEILLQKSSSGNINTELNNLKVLNAELRHDITIKEAEIRELQHDVEQKLRTVQSKNDKLTDTSKQLKQKETKLQETEDKLKHAHRELNDNREEVKSCKNKLNALTEQVQHLETRKKQLMDEAEDWDEKVKDLTERLTEATSGQKQIQEDLAFKENELEVLRDCFLQLKSFENEQVENSDNTDSVDIQEKLKSMMDVSKINASLRTIEEEKNLLQHRIDIEIQARAEMEEQIADLERKAESLQMDKMKADRTSQDLQTKLSVLSNYFKEKELQLQKELGEQQALKKENINKLESAGEKSQMIEQERDIFKMQVEDLKTEIVSAEKDFRSQIATNEKKAHENWLAARSAERELKEARHDNAILRQKLTDLERRLLQGPSGLIRPLPTRGMPPQGLINGPPPPPPGMDRPGSRPPPGPPLRDDDFRGSPDRPLPPPGARVPPPHLDSRSPPTPLGPRMPPPMDGRTPPPYDRRPPLDRRSPPLAYDRGIRYPPPPHMDRRSPGYRMPPPDMLPSFRGPFPPHGPTSPPPPRNELPDSSRFMGSGTPRYPPPHHQERDHTPRQQSQV